MTLTRAAAAQTSQEAKDFISNAYGRCIGDHHANRSITSISSSFICTTLHHSTSHLEFQQVSQVPATTVPCRESKWYKSTAKDRFRFAHAVLSCKCYISSSYTPTLIRVPSSLRLFTSTSLIMTQTLLVSAFPDSMTPQHRLSGEPDSEASHPDVAPAMVPPVKRAKQFALLGIPSSSSSPTTAVTTADDVEDSTPEGSYSPLLFRSFQDGGYARPTTPDHSLTSRSDRTVISTSKHLKLESGHVAGSSRAPLSTKDSIAVLGLSRSPSPDYRILQSSLASSSSQQLDAKNIPPRSSSLSSLPMVTPSPSRPYSPGPSVVVDKDDCSAIVFADPSVIDSDILQLRKRSLPALLPSPIPSRSPSPSIKSDTSHPSPANTLLRRKGSALALLSHKSDNKSSKPTLQVTLDPLPSALMGGGAPMLNVTPVLLEGQWQAKVKTKPTANATPTATTPSKSSTLGRSFKFLRARRALSISSAECLTQSSRTVDAGSKGAEDPAASTVTLVAGPDEHTEPDRVPLRGDLEDGKKPALHGEIMKSERRTKNETVVKIKTQRMVGDAWKEQDYEEVIPILREMKFVGK